MCGKTWFDITACATQLTSVGARRWSWSTVDMVTANRFTLCGSGRRKC